MQPERYSQFGQMLLRTAEGVEACQDARGRHRQNGVLQRRQYPRSSSTQ